MGLACGARYAARTTASSAAANYQVGSLSLGTSAYFTINALGYASEPKWRMETLFLHEAVPGHHMQLARAAEIEGLHPWRSQASFNIAYAEGWALYAESLGYDMGFYKDPYQRYGNLQARLFRAARLVVRIGLYLVVGLLHPTDATRAAACARLTSLYAAPCAREARAEVALDGRGAWG